MIALEKCPCCGGDAIYSYYTNADSEKYSAYVTCSECGGKGWTTNRSNTVVTLNIPAGADTNSYMRKKLIK